MFWFKRGTDFRIVGTLRPLDHANLPRLVRELANRRGHAASAVKEKGRTTNSVSDLLFHLMPGNPICQGMLSGG